MHNVYEFNYFKRSIVTFTKENVCFNKITSPGKLRNYKNILTILTRSGQEKRIERLTTKKGLYCFGSWWDVRPIQSNQSQIPEWLWPFHCCHLNWFPLFLSDGNYYFTWYLEDKVWLRLASRRNWLGILRWGTTARLRPERTLAARPVMDSGFLRTSTVLLASTLLVMGEMTWHNITHS